MENIEHQKPKQEKYSNSNFLARAMVENFKGTLHELSLRAIQNGDDAVLNVLEVGCGEGELLDLFSESHQNIRLLGCDIDAARLKLAAQKNDVIFASAYGLPFQDNELDLLICCEVLEHLNNPGAALQEIARVAKHYVIFSVPNEPLWRALNFARGKYIGAFGNTPGHVNHWSKKQFANLISEFFSVEVLRSPLPWTMLLARVKS